MSVLSDLGSLSWGAWLYALLKAGISAGASVIAANPLAALAGAPAFTPRQLVIFAAASAIVAMAGVLQKSPLPDRKVDIALLSGVHTVEQVEKISKATGSGPVPSPEVAAAIIAQPEPPTGGKP